MQGIMLPGPVAGLGLAGAEEGRLRGGCRRGGQLWRGRVRVILVFVPKSAEEGRYFGGQRGEVAVERRCPVMFAFKGDAIASAG